jgi:hypothetical protein
MTIFLIYGIFMPPIIKCLGHYVMAYASVSVNIPSIIGQTPGSIDLMAAIMDLVSIDFLTNAWVDWSNFLVAHWGSSLSSPCSTSSQTLSSMHPQTTSHSGAYATPCVALVSDVLEIFPAYLWPSFW